MRAAVRPLLLGLVLVAAAGRLGGDELALVTVQVLAALAVLAQLVALPAPAGRQRPGVPDSDGRQRFPSYDRVLSAVLGARRSARLVDLQLRPVLQRLVAGKVEQLGEARVRAVLGEEVWSLADPARPTRSDSRDGGLDTAALTRVVERLEAL